MKPRIAVVVVLLAFAAHAQTTTTAASGHTLEPAELVKLLPEKPLILNVGPRAIFAQAHIPGAEYIGMTAHPQGRKALMDRVQKVPKTQFIVIYCGCCPWHRCPNVKPAFTVLKNLGFKNVKIVHISENFGADWVSKGYPIEKGEPGTSSGK